MGTIFDYLSWRGDLSFDQAPFNEVDSLIFALLSYVDLQGIVPPDHMDSPISLQAVANMYLAAHPDPKKDSIGLIIPKDILKLFRQIKEVRRFRNVGVRAHTNEIDLEREMQFSATTFLPGNVGTVVAFRGTDDTIVGWKENFNMSFLPQVPAQVRAKEYLDEAAAASDGPIYVTGHSKGGNLSAYAAACSLDTTRSRLAGVWNFDGPGFGGDLLLDERYLELKPILQTVLPQSSLVGILLNHDEDYTVVKSRQVGALQHDAFSWNVMGSQLVRLDSVSAECKRTDKMVNTWISEMTPEQREQFSEALYQVLSSDNALTLTDLVSPKNRWITRGMQLDPEVGKVLSRTVRALINENTKSIFGGLFKKSEE